MFKSLTPDGRREIKNVINVIKHRLEKGTLYRLRRNTGINFNRPTINTIEEASELKEKICEFAERNTIDVPDKKKYRKGIRYITKSLLCLFNTFQVEYPDECTYSTFIGLHTL